MERDLFMQIFALLLPLSKNWRGGRGVFRGRYLMLGEK
jgi:hypothetical protein